MQINFSDNTPGDIRLHATVVDSGNLPSGLEGPLSEGASAARFKAKPGQVFEGFVEREGSVARIALTGAGDSGAKNRTLNLEKSGAALAEKYLTSGESAMLLDLGAAKLTAEQAAAVLLGLRLRSWRHDAYRTKLKDEQKKSLASVTVINAPKGTDEAWDDAAAVAEGVELTRDLVAEPANKIYPVSFVERCEKAFAGTGAELVVLDDAQMEELGMGALLGVGQGSEQPSRILCIKWMGGTEGEAPVAFVGKGVTFDTGGISLKPGSGMGDMKWDMGGSGAVVGAMLALARRKAKANVIGAVGLVENMPDGNAQRPGDVVTSMSGQTIEVLNTDAEGRLVLCDVLTWVQREYKPSRIIDLATLTGAMVISLGSEHGGLFANDEDLADDLLAAGRRVDDKLWRFPLSPGYDKLINSPIADMQNIGPRGAGSITAAQFLKRFIENDTPWAHLDIAGVVWADKAGHTWGKGATGFGARLLDDFIRKTAE